MAVGQTGAADQGLLDLRELLNIARRRFWIALATALVVLVLTAVYSAQQTPRYMARSSVALDVSQARVMDIEAVVSGISSDTSAVATEVEILRGRSLAGAVVDRLDLTQYPELNPTLREPDGLAAARARLGGVLRSFLPSQVEERNPAEAISEDRIHEIVVNAVMARRSVERVGVTYVLEISFVSESPQLARDVANAFADEYLESQLEAKFDATERANQWLSERVESLREEVRTYEQAVADFRERENLIDADGATLAEQQVADINNQLAIQRASLSEAQARLDSVRSQLDQGVSPDAIGPIINSEVIQSLRARESDVRSRLAELGSRYGPRHPQVVTANRELADIEEQLDRSIERIISNLQSEVDSARERVRSLQGSLGSARSELAENNSAIVRLRELEREAEAARALFESFLTRFRQTNETRGITEADARIVARAPLPGAPSSPDHTRNLLIGAVLAALIGAAVAAALEFFDAGFRSDSDIERHLGLPHIASVPRLKVGLVGRMSGKSVNPGLYLVEKPLSGFAESFRTLRSAIRLSAIDGETRTVAISSALPGEGKTTTSSALGRISALAGDRTLVIDCDLRRRLLTKELAPGAEKGLLEILNGDASLEDVIRRDEHSDLDILPVAETTFTPRDVFGSRAFEDLLDRLKQKYQLVVIDTAPVLAVADTRAVAARVDAVVLTAEWKKSAVGVVRRAVAELRASRANILGVMLNAVDLESQARYGYDTSGYYYRSYRKYYAD